ncbi:aspartyl/asparaginyl beta-hydroxylase domain-containing protein [bacterium]|nr:aspartyl/asparaginyl beta-hydroxylase domain-containing protein [Akkermansiaceae bacterium]MDB4488216.1 aspartyl/asparaginyl beta-hydroxylase domain-containing protein [bacterium]MDB4541906.1 aspartyl/asparaginyl beta-hydroxylase domain-containing protein [bacterium]
MQFDVERLQSDLELLERDDWIDHFVKQNYEGSWSVLPLRGPSHAGHPVMMIYSDPNCRDFSDTIFLEKAKYIQEVLAQFECPLLAVRLMKLTAGSEIKEHTDHDLSLEDGTVRLHVPVVTHQDIEFYLNGERVVMQEGDCWYLKLSEPHAVKNPTSMDRVHLVIDAEVNDWLVNLIGRARENRIPDESML